MGKPSGRDVPRASNENYGLKANGQRLITNNE
jgi:hypothetical protein